MESLTSRRARIHNESKSASVRADSEQTIACATLGLRLYRGQSGSIWVEVNRGENWVILVPDFNYQDESSRRGAMTVPMKLLQAFFREITE